MGNTQSSEQKTPDPNSPASARPQSVRAKDSLSQLSRTTSRQSSTSSAEPARANTASKPSHTRNRSSTTPGPSPIDSSKAAKHEISIPAASRASTLPITATPTDMSRPMDVPQTSSPQLDHDDFLNEETMYGHGPSDFSRPPRLPLPIEEEVHTPGSPIISPQDFTAAIEEKDDGTIPRRTSVLSSTTIDDDEIADDAAFAVDQSLAPTVPTLIEWKGKGDKVYVTGTFVMWEKKFKLHRNAKTGHFSATLALKPGTHHVKFLVDNDMITSDDLPTTVDFTNILVNYIEVVAPPVPTDEVAEAGKDEQIPGTAVTEGQAVVTEQVPAQPIPIRTAEGADRGEKPASVKAGSLAEPIPIPSVGSRQRDVSQDAEAKPEPQQKVRQTLPQAEYTTEIPQFMLDLDRYQMPEDERYLRAYRVAGTLPTPPSLPLFLAKSILNGTTPHKDDASVLNMPNHTVLNHLATSSIKNDVLATSGTTRYKRKFLTTIMYTPTKETG